MHQTIIGQTNPVAIMFFVLFVLITLGITYWAAKRTRTTKDFYAAGRSITGFQNGLALAGDYMSAASFLGHRGPRVHQGVRRPHLLGGLARGLADRHVPDLGAAPEPRQVHLCRRGRLPAAAASHSRGGGRGLARRRAYVPDRADGRRRHPDQAHVRSALRTCHRDHRRAHDLLRALRRHDRDDLGPDHQGRACSWAAQRSS